MTGIGLLVVVLLAVLAAAEAKVPRTLYDLQKLALEEEIVVPEEESAHESRDTRAVVYPPYQYFEQTLDHFNLIDTRKFAQRYVVNDTFWDGTGPVFFMLGGESSLSRNYVVGFQMAQWGAQFKALLVALEHRYFGASQPFSDLRTENLVYFSVEQVLADAATFTEVIRSQYAAPKSQFIVFGGSYSGMLASDFRIKYPHIADAAIASCATVEPIANYYQYLEVVTKTLASLGSPQCVRNIQAATDIIQPLTQTAAGRAQLSQMFDTCTPIEPRDVPNFMQYLAFWFMYTVQYNLRNQGFNVSTACEMVTNPTQDVLTNYIDVWQYYAGGECIDVTLGAYLDLLNSTATPGGDRQFFWMLCFIQGYWQTSDSRRQVFGNLFDLASQTQICPLIFDGIDFSYPGLAWTKLSYGGYYPDVSKVYYVTGSNDPWYPAGIISTPRGAKYKTLHIKGISHCADMYQPQPWSPPALRPAQQKIRNQLASWIDEYNYEHRHY